MLQSLVLVNNQRSDVGGRMPLYSSNRSVSQTAMARANDNQGTMTAIANDMFCCKYKTLFADAETCANRHCRIYRKQHERSLTQGDIIFRHHYLVELQNRSPSHSKEKHSTSTLLTWVVPSLSDNRMHYVIDGKGVPYWKSG